MSTRRDLNKPRSSHIWISTPCDFGNSPHRPARRRCEGYDGECLCTAFAAPIDADAAVDSAAAAYLGVARSASVGRSPAEPQMIQRCFGDDTEPSIKVPELPEHIAPSRSAFSPTERATEARASDDMGVLGLSTLF